MGGRSSGNKLDVPDWLTGGSLGIVAAKAALMFLVAVLGLRLSQRRTLAQWTAIDFAAAVAVGALVGRTAVAAGQSFAVGVDEPVARVTLLTQGQNVTATDLTNPAAVGVIRGGSGGVLVFDRVPNEHVEAALALGATRWEMIRMAVLPYGRPGVISGSMLGLGRALGETLAVLLIVHVTSQFNFSLFNGGETFASKIANGANEFGLNPGPYLAAGLVLFVLTFIVNAIARIIVERRRAFS